MFQQAQKLDNKLLLENKSKFILIHSSSGFKHSLKGRYFSVGQETITLYFSRFLFGILEFLIVFNVRNVFQNNKCVQ